MRGESRVPVWPAAESAAAGRRLAPDPYDELLDDARVQLAAERRERRADQARAAGDCATVRGVLGCAVADEAPVWLTLAGGTVVAGTIDAMGRDVVVVGSLARGWVTAVALRAISGIRGGAIVGATPLRLDDGDDPSVTDVDLRELAHERWANRTPCRIDAAGMSTSLSPLVAVGDDVLIVRTAHADEVIPLAAVHAIAWRAAADTAVDR